MKRNLKALGVVVAAMFAMAAFASAASAAQFHSNSENTTIAGTQNNIHHFKTGTFDVTCETAEFKGTQAAKTAETQTITPTYSKCHVIILFTFSAEVKFNSCDYSFNANGDVTVKCNTAGDKIEVVSAGCTVKIGAQTIKGGAEYVNSGEGIKVVSKAKGIAYSQSGSSCSTKEGTDAEYTGDATVFGTAGGKATKIWWE